ncbi:MAG TPA: hypothetical protein VMU87_01325 [Stellaceae bacterium]|nr:hypothetical protein [Stellaceae bacterium]
MQALLDALNGTGGAGATGAGPAVSVALGDPYGAGYGVGSGAASGVVDTLSPYAPWLAIGAFVLILAFVAH